MICGKSWNQGESEAIWIFCILQRGHAGPCKDHHGNPPTSRFFEDNPEAQAANERQRIRQAKEDAKKHG
jgi:hypothetical protein